MFKKDRIFWIATAIFILAIVLFAVTQNQLWLALMIASYLLRPTLASLGVMRRYVDERQMSIHYRSGNIAFAAMMITAVALAVEQSSKGDRSWEMFTLLIVVGLATKALFNVLLTKDYRAVGSRIIVTIGLLMVLFAAMEEGFSLGTLMNALPGLVIVGIGLLARRYPRSVGALIFAVTVALVILVLSKGFTFTQITVALLLAVPLIVAGSCLFARSSDEGEPAEQSSTSSAATN